MKTKVKAEDWFYLKKHDTGDITGRINEKDLALKTARRHSVLPAGDKKIHPIRVEDAKEETIAIFINGKSQSF